MSLNNAKPSKRRRSKGKHHSSKKRAGIEGQTCRTALDEGRRHKKSFSKLLSSLLGKSKTTAGVIFDDSANAKKSSNVPKAESTSPFPATPQEANDNRKIKATDDEYRNREIPCEIPSSRSQLRREPLHRECVTSTSKGRDNKIDFSNSARLCNTNVQPGKKVCKTKASGKELMRPDDAPGEAATAAQMFKNNRQNMQNAISKKKTKLKKVAKERDILSFFDTGYVTSNSVSNGVEINELHQPNDEVNFRSPLSTPETDQDHVPHLTTLRAHKACNSYIFRPDPEQNTSSKPKNVTANVFRFKKPQRSVSKVSRSKSKTACNDSDPPVWYCKRIPHQEHTEPCKEEDTLQANEPVFRHSPTISPRLRAETLVKKYFPKQLSPQEKKYLTYAIGIILATAGIAAFFMFLSKPRLCNKPRTKVADECCENEIEDECFPEKNNCWGTADDDACVYEKHQCVKCQNPNYKAVVSATEKLHEDDDVVCALQDLKKVTKRVKGHKRSGMKRYNGVGIRDAPSGGRCGEYFKGTECTQKCDFKDTDCTQRCDDKCRSRCA